MKRIRKSKAEQREAGPESEDARRLRLVVHAATMREARRARKAVAHTCPPHETDAQLAALNKVLQRVAPDNIAPVPIAMMFEDNEWTVDVTIKINGIAEYDLSGKHESLSDAIASARREVNKQKYNENRSANDAARYGLSY